MTEEPETLLISTIYVAGAALIGLDPVLTDTTAGDPRALSYALPRAPSA